MLRFTIRDALWLMVVAAMGVAWFVDHRWQTSFTGVTVLPDYVTSRIHAEERLELRVLPSGEIDGRVVPDR